MMQILSADQIREALSFVSSDDRDLWVRMAMAVKSELGDSGFQIWDSWSQLSDSYDIRAARDVWKSAKIGGKITIGTLIYEARQNGYAPDPSAKTGQSAEEIAERKRARELAAAAYEEEQKAKRKAAADTAVMVWEAATPSESHPYTERKKIPPLCARIGSWPGHPEKDVLILPVRSGKTIHSLQAIFPDGQRRFLSGGAVKGNYMLINPDSLSMDTIVICEGYATGVSIYQATKYPVIVAFSASNLFHVAQKARKLSPQSNIIIAADNDQWTDGNPGLTEAKKSGREVNARVVWPEFTTYPDDMKPTDFNDLYTLESLESVAETIRGTQKKTLTESVPFPTVSPARLVESLVFDPRKCNGSGKPLGTIENLHQLITHTGVNIRYNVIKKDVEIIVPGESYSVDNNTNASLAWLVSACTEARMSTANLAGYLTNIADKNQYNPVAQWIESKPWDGLDRITFLTNSLGSTDFGLTNTLLKKWMVGAVHAVYNPRGIENSSVLVLQGEQYAGKTAWFRSLMGDNFEQFGKESAILNPHDKDSQIGVLTYWIVELGELDATFKKSDVAALKSFISKDIDEIRRPYDRGMSKYPRRTVFIASVNPRHYLQDETGNRRYWTIECGSTLNPHHGIDMQQAWAQVLKMYQSGQSWKLTRDEMRTLNSHNERYKSPDPIEELILDAFDPDPALPRVTRLSASKVLQAIGYKNIQIKDTKTAAAILRRHFGDPVGNTGGCDTYALPLRKE